MLVLAEYTKKKCIGNMDILYKKMGQAGFEPATSQSEAGHPIQTRLQALYTCNIKKQVTYFHSLFLKNLIELR